MEYEMTWGTPPGDWIALIFGSFGDEVTHQILPEFLVEKEDLIDTESPYAEFVFNFRTNGNSNSFGANGYQNTWKQRESYLRTDRIVFHLSRPLHDKNAATP